MRSIINAFKDRFDKFNQRIAQGIASNDRRVFSRSVATTVLMMFSAVVTVSLILIGIYRFFQSFWGRQILKIIIGILVLYLLYLSYQANRENNTRKRTEKETRNHLEVWAEDIYEYVRDAMFLVLRAVSEHTEIIMPTSPGTVELPNPISIRDGYAVFNFFAKVRNPVDPARMKADLTRTLNQMQRAHELKGLPCDLVQINGSYYCPLLILDIVDFGDAINIAVVFANEKTIGIARAYKQLNLQRLQGQRTASSDFPYDDQL